MKEQFVTYKIALVLKELGFDEPYIAYWKNNQALLQKWLREKHGIKVIADTDITLMWIYTIQSLHPRASYTGNFIVSDYIYNTYEEALEAGLQQALKLIK